MSNMNSANNSMISISSLKDKIKWIIPSSMQKPLNTFMDLLDVSYKVKNTKNPSLIGNISTLLTQITEFIKQKVIEMNLSGLAKSFFDNLISLILLIGIIISYTRGGKMKKSKKYKSKKSKKHRKTRRH
jgi:amino acid permease